MASASVDAALWSSVPGATVATAPVSSHRAAWAHVPCFQASAATGVPARRDSPKYGSTGFHVVSGARVDKNPPGVQGGRFGRAAKLACELHMVSAKQLTMEAYVVFVEDRPDNPYPAAQQGRSHDREVGCLLCIDAPKPHEVAAIGGG